MRGSRRIVIGVGHAALAIVVMTALLGSPIAQLLGHPGRFSFADGARETLAATLLVLAASSAMGTALGGAAALGSPLWDALLARAVELSGAIPSLVSVLVLRAIAPLPGLASIAVVLAVVHGLATAKIVRSEALQIMSADFVLAARALGSSRSRLFRKHVFPHVSGAAIAGAPFAAASVVGLDAALTFLGFSSGGTSWGALIAEAAQRSAMVPMGPVVGVTITVASLYVISDAYEDRFRIGRRHV